jgi:hypothetical protein
LSKTIVQTFQVLMMFLLLSGEGAPEGWMRGLFPMFPLTLALSLRERGRVSFQHRSVHLLMDFT